MKNLICICCPKGCHLTVDENNGYAVTGNTCKRGEVYGKQEVENPQRIVTSTVTVADGAYIRCPVKTDKTIPKGMMFEAMKTLNHIQVSAPITLGQVIVANVCNTGANFIATKAIEKR